MTLRESITDLRHLIEADKPSVPKVTTKLKGEIAKAFAKHGLDGNGTFVKPEHGYAKALDVLGDFGIEMAGVVDSMRFRGEKNQFTLDLAWTNKADSFSPTEIANSMLAVSWYKRREDSYEVLAYLS